MTTTLMIIQAIVAILLIIVVLLQFGKGAEAGLMSGASDSVMTGGQQGNILSKITIVLSILFLGNSILLSKLQHESAGKSLLDDEAPVTRPLNSDAITPPTNETKATDPATNSTPATEENTDEQR